MSPKILLKTPYILLYFVFYRYFYLFCSLFLSDITIHPVKDLANIPNSPVTCLVSTGTALFCILPVILFMCLERKTGSKPFSEFVRVLSMSLVLVLFSMTSALYKITLFYELNASDISWSVTVLCIFFSIIVLWIYFYYNKLSQEKLSEWNMVIGKMRLELNEDKSIISEEVNILLSLKEKIDSFESAAASSPESREEIEYYYEEIRKSYYSLISEVPKD